ncbi:MAG: Uma2 family endonuclease [Armatimonadetes bacterium]|nr:Uma2 family endonuclease [Armatimonadota bacterium]
MAEVIQRLKRIPMSREEFEKLPEGPPFYDYIGGEAIEVNRPTGKHQEIVGVVWYALRMFLSQHELGRAWFDIDVLLPTGSTVGPDISVLLTEHLDRYDEQKGDISGVPDLVVEVSSLSTAEYDRVEKMRVYQQAGVPWVWLIDQESLTIEEFQWTPEGYLRVNAVKGGEDFKPKLFPELVINLKALLGRP